MSRVFITGSADGLGLMAAKLLISQGHQVAIHARNAERAEQALSQVPLAEKVLIADLSDIEETKNIAAKLNAMGRFDAVIHNAGVYRATNNLILAVNTIAPYILTCLMQRPERLVYLSSAMHLQGDPSLRDLISNNGRTTYSDSKLHVVLLAMAVARKWPGVFANAVNSGWFPTKMGGRGAPDDLDKGVETQVWLSVSNDKKAKRSGCYFFHQQEARYLTQAADTAVQDKFISLCEEISGVRFPAG